MGGYANGGDADANATSTDPQSRLGGDGGPYVLTAAEISVIVVTITSFITALLMVFYYQKLQARRNIDMMNQASLIARQPLTTPGGEFIELKDGCSSSTAATSAPVTPLTIIDNRTTTRDNIQRISTITTNSLSPRLPLWKYIHWKNPNNTILPRVESRRDIQGMSISIHLSPILPPLSIPHKAK